MPKKFTLRGKSFEEMKEMGLKEFSELLTSRKRRSIKRGLSYEQKRLLKKIEKGKNFVKTKRRDMIILPQMVGNKISVYSGKEYVTIEIKPEMLGHFLGEFVPTRRETKHSSPGMGATRSSKFVPLK